MSQSRSESRFSFLPLQENLLPDLLFDLLWTLSPNLLLSYFWATSFFSGIPGLVAHAGPSQLNLSPTTVCTEMITI